MDALLPFFQLLYFIAHFFVSLLLAGYNTFCDVQQTVKYLYQWTFHKNFSEDELFNYLQHSKSVKVPSHPAFVFLPGQLSNASSDLQCSQICTTLSFFVKAKSEYLSLYDAAGLLTENKLMIKDKLQQLVPEVDVIITENIKLEEFQNIKATKRLVTTDENNEKSKVVLNIQSYESGMKSMIKTVQHMSHLNEDSIEKITSSDVHELLSDEMYKRKFQERNCKLNFNIPDPDLIIVIGEYLSSSGFPCWFLRLSEFVLIPSLFRLDYSNLHKILEKYSCKEQRYGR